jgi:hypothetical protein
MKKKMFRITLAVLGGMALMAGAFLFGVGCSMLLNTI